MMRAAASSMSVGDVKRRPTTMHRKLLPFRQHMSSRAELPSMPIYMSVDNRTVCPAPEASAA